MMIFRRRSLLGGAFGLAVLAASGAGAQPLRRTPRIGFMIGTLPGTVSPLETAFRDELKTLGLIEGDTIILEIRRSMKEGDMQRQAAELGAMELDFIVAASLVQALTVRAANPRMPMVIGTGPNLVGNGFAQSLERPGGIVTGMEELTPGITARRLQALHDIAPGIRRVALLSTTPGVGGHEIQLADAEVAGRRLGLALSTYRATTEAELREALAAIVRDRCEGLQSFQGGLSVGRRHAIVRFAEEQRLPAVYQSDLFVRAGGLMSYAPDQEEQFRIAARNVLRIVNGERPGDIPIQRPKPYFLTINRTAAAAIGLAIPQTLSSGADRLVDHPRREGAELQPAN